MQEGIWVCAWRHRLCVMQTEKKIKGTELVRDSISAINLHDQRQLREERVCFIL